MLSEQIFGAWMVRNQAMGEVLQIWSRLKCGDFEDLKFFCLEETCLGIELGFSLRSNKETSV